LDQVQVALRQAGLESSNLILGVDFTKSNEWTGKHSFSGRSLHAIGEYPNPYEQAITIIGQTLAVFDEDNLIPCFGFGDASTHDQYVFSFYQDHRPCEGFGEALTRYRQIVPNLKLAGPTSFAPIIEAAVKTVEESGGQYHVLVIVADGQVTRSVDTGPTSLSPQEKSTIDAIVVASEYPLSIILIGVGDGPWDMMREFDDNIPARSFDNFQFVNFSEIMARNLAAPQLEALFALAALMEIPQQYKATMELDLLGRQTGRVPPRGPLPPPQAVLQADLHVRGMGLMGSFAHQNSFTTSQSTRPQYPPSGDYTAKGSEYGSHSTKYYPPTSTTYPPTTYPPSTPYGYPDQSKYTATSRDVAGEQVSYRIGWPRFAQFV
jgi:E3 ubiquitin-protein ligase RGLG